MSMDKRQRHGADRRLSDRYLCSEIVKISYRDGERRTIGLSAVVEDVSESGICLLLEEPLGTGGWISFRVDGESYSGRVVHAAERGDGMFRIGLAFEEGKWSEESAWPELRLHLASE